MTVAHRNPTGLRIRTAAMLVVVCAIGNIAIAQVQQFAQIQGQLQKLQPSMLQVRLPPRGVSKQTGLFLELSDDGLGIGQFGYRRLFFTFHTPTPLAGDTQITVRAFVSDWNRSRNTVAVEADGELLAGQTSTTVVVRIPQTNEWHQVWWTVWIDGVHDPGLSLESRMPHHLNDVGNSRWQNEQMLRLDSAAHSTNLLNQLFAQQTGRPGLATLLSRQASGGGFAGNVVNSDLSDNWLDYTPYDIVSIDLQSLKKLAKNDPTKFRALEAWVRSGGNLWVEEVGRSWNVLGSLHPLFGWPEEKTIQPIKPEDRSPAGAAGWSYVDLRQQTFKLDDGLVRDFEPNAAESRQSKPTVSGDPIFTEDWFIVRRHGWGMVGGFNYDFNARPRSISRKARDAAANFWVERSWPKRHGTVPGMANNDFSNWLIPGVGLAPVISFQVLITLFVLVIGPANYWLLKRFGRLHLMVLTVPLAALAITLALLGYGVFSDGFATRVRALSITLLDQQTGEGATWSRLSYYAAFAPSKGLTFTDDTAVYPIHPGSLEAYDADVTLAKRDLVWVPGEQRLTQGWLASRTPTQYLAVQPRTTDLELSIDMEGEPSVTNLFDSDAQLIVVVDENGDFWIAEDVETNEQMKLEKVDRPSAVTAVREQLSGREPQFPDGFAAVEDSPLLYDQQRMRRRRYRRQNMGYAVDSASESLLQDRWFELLGFGGAPAVDLKPNSYLAVCETAPLPFSMDEFPVEDSSVHLVVGKW